VRAAAGLASGLVLLPAPLLAHVATGGLDRPGWTAEPWLVASLVVSFALYAVGAARLARRSGPGRPVLARRAAAFAFGWLTLVVAAASPLHQGGQRSFTLHMIEHELLMLVAAPLLVAARPFGAMVWAFPKAVRKGFGAVEHQPALRASWLFLAGPVTATLVQAAILWLWHAPGLFDLALAHEGWHIAQHLSFLVSALFFWQAMFDYRARPGGLGVSALCLFATSLVAGALGALMAFSQSPWYARYAALGMAPFGLSPTEDQQLAGLLMWIPGGLVHAGAALALIALALRQEHGASRPSLAEPLASDP
jgi:cytochrome c oxidase assembly factor CtaG